MGRIFLTSDFHFAHDKPFILEPRGFETVEEMNETIIKNFNSVVTDEDDVYVLGDLCLKDRETGMNCIRQLNGKLHIIAGNHCSAVRREMYAELPNVVEVVWATMIEHKKYNFYLSHFPTITSNFDDGKPNKKRVWNLCGHTHTSDRFLEMRKGIPAYHVEMEAHNCFPVLLEDIIEDIKQFMVENK